MKTNQSFSLLFWARTSKDSALNASIYARITVNGKRIEFSLSKNILKSEWDSKKGRVKGSRFILPEPYTQKFFITLSIEPYG
ncbi:Arm DNA-binding domain-containing protein [uncultured Tenacibaculum sp.]|uniref:Arm DNA-binding domain-containing protein n=1 Tax=uncultured Tenacibaculum sp. TaxID=174713 RepID=UPI00342C6A1B